MKTFLTLCAVIALAATAFPQGADVKTVPVYSYAGVPANGTSEVDTLTIQTSTSAGTFTITVAGSRTTTPITWSATDATLISNIDTALENLPIIGSGGVVVSAGTGTSGIGTYLITMSGKNARKDMPLLSIGTNSLTGGTAPTLTTTTAGVAATWAEAPIGTLIEDSTNGELYQNISTTANSPNWQLFRGWKTGSGGAVTQITSRATGVTINTRVGKITTTADSLAAVTPAVFTVTNSTVAAVDNITLTKVSGDVDTQVSVNSVGAGSFTVLIWNTHASGADTTALVFNFEVRKGAID